MTPNATAHYAPRDHLKRNYKHYYAQDKSGEWVEVERQDCVSYDLETSFTGKYPQRWYCDFEAEYIVRLSRDKAGERFYNAVKYLRRKEKKLIAEQFGCVGDDCPKCKDWNEIVDGKTKCDKCPHKVVFITPDLESDFDGSIGSLDIDSGIDIVQEYETSYLIETLHEVLGAFTSDERRLWKCLAVEMKKKDIALLFGWTVDKLSYREKVLFNKLRSEKRLKDFFENR
jgi:hypothetical protein